MKKILMLVFITCFLSESCNNDDDFLLNTCNVSNPIENLSWLKDEILNLQQSDSDLKKYFFVTQNTLNGETVFIFPNCCPQCSTVVPVFNCEGENLGFVGSGNINNNILDNDVIIWKPNNFACN